MNTPHTTNSGQALIVFLFFVLMGITITSAAVMMLLNTMINTSVNERSLLARAYAESGVENALIRYVRNPVYSGEVLTIGQGSVDVTISGGIIVAVAKIGDVTRTIQATTVYNNDEIVVTSWKEIY